MEKGNYKSSELSIAESFTNLFKTMNRAYTVFEGIIESVDLEAFTCSVIVGDSNSSVTYEDVYLEVLFNAQSSFILIPKIGSDCLMCFRDGTEDRRQLLKCHEVDKIIANPDTLFQFNTGENGGLVLVNPLVDALNKLVADVNKLKTVFQTWIPASGDGGAALKTAATEWFGEVLPENEAENLENTKVTQ